MCVPASVVETLSKSAWHSGSCMIMCVFCIPAHPCTRFQIQGGCCVSFARGRGISRLACFPTLAVVSSFPAHFLEFLVSFLKLYFLASDGTHDTGTVATLHECGRDLSTDGHAPSALLGRAPVDNCFTTGFDGKNSSRFLHAWFVLTVGVARYGSQERFC